MATATESEKPTILASDKIKVNWIAKEGGLAQIYNRGLEFALIAENWDQCCPFVLCKDFLQDALWAFFNKKVTQIYGFTYDPAKCPPIYLDRTRIALRNSQDKDFASKIAPCVQFLNQIEKELRFVRTVQYECENPKKHPTFIFDGSSKWMQSPPMISLYSLLVRCGFTHKLDDDYKNTIKNILTGTVPAYQTHDQSYLRQSEIGFKRIARYGWKAFYREPARNYPGKANVNTIHNCGIVGYSGNAMKEIIPYWYRAKIKVG